MNLAVNGVQFAFEKKIVLDEISFHVKAGQFLGIVGPNGAGKSTLLRCLNATWRPQKGAVLLDGIDISALSPLSIAKKIGFVPQNCSPGFPFIVEDFVGMGRYAHESDSSFSPSNEKEIVKKSLKQTGALSLIDRAVSEISGGEFRKVLIAQVLAQETPLLLLDEPLHHLDLRHQLEIMELMRALSSRPDSAVVAVLHDLTMAARFCDELLLLNEGCIVALGTPKEVLKPAILKEVYGVEVVVRDCAVTGKLEIVPVKASEA